jgi:hypothetical protein
MFTGRSMHYSGFLGDLAEALADTGRADEGLAVIEDALARFERDDVQRCLPDALRIKGDLYCEAPGVWRSWLPGPALSPRLRKLGSKVHHSGSFGHP